MTTFGKGKFYESENEFLLEKKFKTLSFWFGVAVILISLLVLIGWIQDIRVFKSISPSWISMKSNTALCFLLAGISIALQNPIKPHINSGYKKTLSITAVSVFGLIAALNLYEYFFKINPSIDELIFKEDARPFATLYPGRMAPITVLCFLLLSIANLFYNYKISSNRIFQIPFLIVCIISLVGLSGYIFNAEEMFAYGGFNSMAFHTVICFFFLSVASLFSRPRDGLMKLVSSDTIGGKLIRKILPFAAILLFLLCWLHLKGEQTGFYNLNFGNGILLISFIIIFAITLYFSAAYLTQFEKEIIVKATELENSLKEISDYKYALDQSSIISITDPEGNIKFINEKFIKIFKFSKEELIGHNHNIINSGHHPKEFFTNLWTTILAGKVWRNDVKSKTKDGSYYWADTTIIPFINGEGKPFQYVAIRNDITKRKEADEEILKINKELHRLSSHLQNIREEERTHIAREIHDELGQQITSLKMDIGWILHKQMTQDIIVASQLQKTLQDLLLLCDGIITTVRKISTELRPAIIDNLGLIAALEWKCNNFEEKMMIPCKFISYIEETKFESNFSINVFRILQEALTNIGRHAKAKSVIVYVINNETEFILQITDDGIGIDTDLITENKTLGISGMKERADLLGGDLIIKGEKNTGTTIKLTIPLKNEYIIG